MTVLYLELDPGVYEVSATREEGRHLQARNSEKTALRPHDRADGRGEHRLDRVILVVHLLASGGARTPPYAGTAGIRQYSFRRSSRSKKYFTVVNLCTLANRSAADA